MLILCIIQICSYCDVLLSNSLTQGAYDSHHVYTQDMIKNVIEYAKERGIRVIVEFDTPVRREGWVMGQVHL